MSTTLQPDTGNRPATTDQQPTPQEQAGLLLGHLAGYVAVRTVQIGLENDLISALAEAGPAGLTAEALAIAADVDTFYARVWSRAAIGAGVVERNGSALRLSPHLPALLLDGAHPAHVGAIFRIFAQPEIFDRFGERLATGQRTWWDATGHEFISAVASTGLPFYVRLIPGGLGQVPGLEDLLATPLRILDTACGSGEGLVRLAEHYPAATIVGADGDAYSLERARKRLADAGLDGRVELIHTPLEELDLDGEFDLVINNISMHECRDIDRVTERIRRALVPGGWFVISDFPFPDDDAGLRSVPGRVMSGIQFFEAQIDDQLLPVSAYLDLLDRHGFADVATTSLTPTHALTYGRKPTAL